MRARRTDRSQGGSEAETTQRLVHAIAQAGWTLERELGALVTLARSDDPKVALRAIATLIVVLEQCRNDDATEAVA